MITGLEIASLSQEQVQGIYRDHLVLDFPEDEVKPLRMILQLMNRDEYRCIGLFEKGKLRGYAFFVDIGGIRMLDYFAVLREHRSRGLGSAFLRMLMEQLRGPKCIIAEVEDPNYGGDPKEISLRERRLAFYLRNGCVDSGAVALTFGVHYRLLTLGAADDVAEKYRRLYRSMLPEAMYQGNVLV